MDLFDLLMLIPVPLPGGPSRERSPEENLTAAICLTVFPILDFLIALFGGLWAHPVIALIVLPAAFAGAAIVVNRASGTSGLWTLATSLGCAALCFMASGAAFLIGVFASFYSGF